MEQETAGEGGQPPAAMVAPSTMPSSSNSFLYVAAVIFALLGYFLSKRWYGSSSSKAKSDSLPERVASQEAEVKKGDKKKKSPVIMKGGGAKDAKKTADKATHHPLYVNVLKGFSGVITCVAVHPEGNAIAVSCTDSSLRVFNIAADDENVAESLKNPSYARSNIAGDFLTAMDFTFDGLSIVGALDSNRKFARFQVTKDSSGKPLQKAMQGTTPMHRSRVRWLSASKGKWVVTCSEEDDTDVKVWSYSGDLLAVHDTKQVRNFHMAVSPISGKFVGIAAWVPGAKVMEIVGKNKEFSKFEKAMDLKSACGVNAVAFSTDDTRAVIVCKDATMAVWDINVRYQVSEDPRKLREKQDKDPMFKSYSMLGFSHDGRRIVGIADRHIKVIDTDTLETLQIIEEAHASPIETLAMSASSRMFVTGAGDNRPRIWSIPA